MNTKDVLANARHNAGADVALRYGTVTFGLLGMGGAIWINQIDDPLLLQALFQTSVLGVLLLFILCLLSWYFVGRKSRKRVHAYLQKTLDKQGALRAEHERLAQETHETERSAKEVLHHFA